MCLLNGEVHTFIKNYYRPLFAVVEIKQELIIVWLNLGKSRLWILSCGIYKVCSIFGLSIVKMKENQSSVTSTK